MQANICLTGATVSLEQGTNVIDVLNPNITDTEITGQIFLFAAQPGTYDAVVTNPGGAQASLDGALSIVHPRNMLQVGPCVFT